MTEETPEKLANQLSTLDSQRIAWVAQGNLEEANRTFKEFQQLKQISTRQEFRSLKAQQRGEITSLEQDFQREFAEFNQDWDKKLEEYSDSCKEGESKMIEKHKAQNEALTQKMKEKIPEVPKHSVEYLNMKRSQDTLVKKKEYEAALALQKKMDDLQQQEQVYWGAARSQKVSLKRNNLHTKQKQEMNSFKMKCCKGLDELTKKRAKETECFVRKFQNLKQELDTAHKSERARFKTYQKVIPAKKTQRLSSLSPKSKPTGTS